MADEQLNRISIRALAEARAGAPADLVAFYVVVEVQHLRAGHTGSAQHCEPCNGMAAAFVRGFHEGCDDRRGGRD
jgi:hypothetical protein